MEIKNLQIIDSKLSQHFLNQARSKDCPPSEFRFAMERITDILLTHSFQALPTLKRSVTTPLETIDDAPFLDDSNLVFASIMRAGNAMLDAALRFFPRASAAHIGIHRDENHRPVTYYFRSPKLENKTVILLDPMLATGGSAVKATKLLKEKGATQILMLCIVSVADGVNALVKEFPDIKIYTAALDRELNENAYILPGLGDAGDRVYSTT